MSAACYTCEACGGTFEKTRPDDEAAAEFSALFPEEGAPQESGAAIVCDDCFKKIMTFHGREHEVAS